MSWRVLLASELVVASLGGCGRPPGVLVGPQGTEPLRTASYFLGDDGPQAELVLVLSNDDLACTLPGRDAADSEYQRLLVAACREDARHAVLVLYDDDGTWRGTFPGADPDGLGDQAPDRWAHGWYYAVLEASLFAVSGLERGYLVDDDELVDLGDDGTVDVHLGDQRLSGWLDFPGDRVSARFDATRCDGGLVDLVNPVALCQGL